ncbi:aspartic proteinase NANA, chloroplast-like [Argentina anserina]|uniref:aspartic proteinase NANA, chloroplast-like n=1 Tax=Argentina anserina TaxID=57926 RepID=UPI0021768BFA|nr:aspartic proteinase NANA, chloroplast-like [Potentilla anserina]
MKGMRSTGSTTFLFIIFWLSAIHHGLYANGEHTIRLPLVHKYSPHFKGGIGLINKTDIDVMKELHLHDIIRRQTIFSRNKRDGRQIPRRKDAETNSSSLSFPVHSGYDIMSGLYMVEVKIGTPPTSFYLIADTASDLNWVDCKYDWRLTNEAKQKLLDEAKRNYHADQRKALHFLKKGRVFRADLSSTFKPIACSNPLCKNDLVQMHAYPYCPTPTSPCRYNYTYMGGNRAEGFFGYDTITVPVANGGETNHLPNMLIGCSEVTYQLGEGDGILGLGFGDYSFPESLVTTKVAGKFSYCLMNHMSNSSVASYLTIGPNNQAVTSPMRYTELVMKDARGLKTGNYGAKLSGISIGGTLLKIPSRVWDEMTSLGGIIFDSGSTNTWLAPPIYRAVMDELIKSLSKYQKIKIDAVPFDFCFVDKGYDESLVPRLAFHFAGNVIFEPPVRNYVLDVRDKVKCLGFVPAFDGQSMIGNQMQQNHLWEFDVLGGKLGFAPSICI